MAKYTDKLPLDFGIAPTRSLIKKMGLEATFTEDTEDEFTRKTKGKFIEDTVSFPKKEFIESEVKHYDDDLKHVMNIRTYHQRMLTFSRT